MSDAQRDMIRRAIQREQAAGNEEAVNILVDLGAELLAINDKYSV